MVDLAHLHHCPILYHHFHSSSSVISLVFASNSPSAPSKLRFHSHKQPNLWTDPWIWVALNRKKPKDESIIAKIKLLNLKLSRNRPKSTFKGRKIADTWNGRIRVRQGMNSFSSTTHERRNQSVLLRRNVIHLQPKCIPNLYTAESTT